MKNALWISYDLGVQGNYESMFAWLDKNTAVECGDSLAFLNYAHSGDLLKSLIVDLKKSVGLTPRTRIYVIYRDKDSTKMKGKFIIGGRKSPSWAGFAASASPDADEI